jgi:hypothetical protein
MAVAWKISAKVKSLGSDGRGGRECRSGLPKGVEKGVRREG